MAVSIMDFLIGIVKDPKVIENSVVDGLGYRMTWIKMENGEKISVKYDRGISVSVNASDEKKKELAMALEAAYKEQEKKLAIVKKKKSKSK